MPLILSKRARSLSKTHVTETLRRKRVKREFDAVAFEYSGEYQHKGKN